MRGYAGSRRCCTIETLATTARSPTERSRGFGRELLTRCKAVQGPGGVNLEALGDWRAVVGVGAIEDEAAVVPRLLNTKAFR